MQKLTIETRQMQNGTILPSEIWTWILFQAASKAEEEIIFSSQGKQSTMQYDIVFPRFSRLLIL